MKKGHRRMAQVTWLCTCKRSAVSELRRSATTYTVASPANASNAAVADIFAMPYFVLIEAHVVPDFMPDCFRDHLRY